MSPKFNVKAFLLVKGCIVFASFVSTFCAGHLRMEDEGYRAKYEQQITEKAIAPGTEATRGKRTDVMVGTVFAGRKLRQAPVNDQADLNCTPPGIGRFPRTIFTETQRENGAVILNFLLTVYLIGAVGYVCFIYFVPSLEITSKMLGIQEDVAGATFMAIGSSAPEFFSSVVGTFVTHDNTALGAIIGSTAFNLFVIISLCSLVPGGSEGLQLSWYPVIRDTVCWIIATIILMVVTYDEMVQWWEGLIMTVCFAGYVAIMYFNKPLSAFVLKWSAHANFLPCSVPGRATSESADGTVEMEETAFMVPSTSEEGGTDEVGSSRTSYQTGYVRDDGTTNADVSSQDDSDTEKTLPSVFDPPTATYLYVMWILGLPIILMLYYTVPDCRKSGVWRRCYPVTFVMSAVWLALLSYLLYWMIVIIGYTLGVPDVVMGYTVLAIGTSIPDAIASVLVARDGLVDMAMANIIGSNIFEMLICLGFVWFLKSMTSHPSAAPVIISVDGLLNTAIFLLLFVSFLIVAIHNNCWKLDKKIGIIALLFYILFIVWATLNAEGVFRAAFEGNLGQPKKPPCPLSLLDP